MVYCEATIENEALRKNLIQCVKALGGEPCIYGNTVTVLTVENEAKMAQLFEQFSNYELRIEFTD